MKKHFKKSFSFAISLVILLTSLAIFPVSAGSGLGQATAPVSGINVGRGENELIVYNVKGQNTNTNEWGYEIIADSAGKIISVGGNNQKVPADGGCVVSGHGTSAQFLRENARKGRYITVSYDAMFIIIADTPVPPNYEKEVKIDGINIFRDTDFLVIYTGSGTTDTNCYGTEACVDADGLITSVGGNNRAIPKGGFVISGHGVNSDFVMNNLKAGMYASYNEQAMTLTVSYTEKSSIYNDNIKLNEAKEVLDRSIDDFADINKDECIAEYNRLRQEYNDAVNNYNAHPDTYHYWQYSEALDKEIEAFLETAVESSVSEYRAVWIRPLETNRQEVKDKIQKLYDLGANAVYIETFYNNTTIYPTENGSLYSQNPYFNGFDVLNAYIEECHARDMELHCWYPVLCAGHTSSNNKDISLFTKRPDLCVKNDKNSIYSTDDSDWMFLDPSNPDTVAFLVDNFRYLLKNYDIDCLELDYIRYAGCATDDWGYFGNAAKKFEETHGFAPTYDTQAPWWSDWAAIRASYVTDLVRKISEMRNEVSPHTALSADVSAWPESTGKLSIYQDCSTWTENGYVEMLHPMAYGKDVPENMTRFFLPYIKNRGVLVTGLGAFESSVPTGILNKQILYCRDTKNFGHAVFESIAFINKASDGLIQNGVYKNRANAPLRRNRKSICDYIDYMISKLGRMKDAEAVKDADYRKAVQTLEDANAAFQKDGGMSTEGKSFISAFDTNIGDYKVQNTLRNDIQKIDSMTQLAYYSKEAKNSPICRTDSEKMLIWIKENTSGKVLAPYMLGYNDIKPDSQKIIATGDKLSCTRNLKNYDFTAIVKGDVSCDGQVSSIDYLILKRTFLQNYTLEEPAHRAGCITNGSSLTAADYIKIKRHVLGTFDLFV